MAEIHFISRVSKNKVQVQLRIHLHPPGPICLTVFQDALFQLKGSGLFPAFHRYSFSKNLFEVSVSTMPFGSQIVCACSL